MLDETNYAIMDMAQMMKQLLGQSQPPVFETVYEEGWCPPEQMEEDDPSDFIHVDLIRVQGHNGRYRQTEFLLETVTQANWDVYEKRQEWLDVVCQSRAIRTAVARFEQLRQAHPYFSRLRVGAVVMNSGDKPVNIGVGVITEILPDGGYAIDLGGYTVYHGKESAAVKGLRVLAPSIEALFEGMPHALAAYKRAPHGKLHVLGGVMLCSGGQPRKH